MHYWYRIQQWFIQYIHLQLFITLIVLPFLIAWGLPISILSPISTLIFSPFLLLFLFFSSVIFFLELLYLPNGLVIRLLEYTSYCWVAILNWEQTSWLKGFIKPTPIILLLIPLSAFFIIHFKYTHQPSRNIIMLSSLLFIIYCGLTYLQKPTQSIYTLSCRKKEVTLICKNNQLIFIDPGSLAGHTAVQSWLSYTFVPYLIESTGKLVLDHAIILQPSARVFEALALLCTKIEIKKLYLPWWQDTLPHHAWRHFFALQKIAEEKNCKLIRPNKKRIEINLSDTDKLSLIPQTNVLRYSTASYPAIYVEGIIDKQPFHLYPNQANNKK